MDRSLKPWLVLLTLATLHIETCPAGQIGLTTRTLTLPEAGSVTNWVLHTAKASFAFMPPPDWKLEPSPHESRILWTSDDSARLSLAVAPEEIPTTVLTNLTALGQYVTNRFPGATLQQTATCHTEAEAGSTFDLRWTGPQEKDMTTRLAIVRVADTTFEFVLTAPRKAFPAAIPQLQALLTSFQVAPRNLPH